VRPAIEILLFASSSRPATSEWLRLLVASGLVSSGRQGLVVEHLAKKDDA
jgi:hypothetical protein